MRITKQKIKTAVTVPSALSLLFIFVLSFIQPADTAFSLYRNFRDAVSNPSMVHMNIGRAMTGETGSASSEESDECGNLSCNLVFLTGSARSVTPSLSFSGLNFLSIPAALTLIFTASIKKRNNSLRGRMRACKARYLKFLDPVEQSIRSRADEYDINPVRNFLREIKPVFCQAQSTGFFYGVNGEAL